MDSRLLFYFQRFPGLTFFLCLSVADKPKQVFTKNYTRNFIRFSVSANGAFKAALPP